MTDPTYTHVGAGFVIGGQTGIVLRTDDDTTAELILSDDEWLQLGQAIARWFPSPVQRRASAAADAALTGLRRARDAGEFNADEETIVARMERLAASRPPRQDGAPGGEGP